MNRLIVYSVGSGEKYPRTRLSPNSGKGVFSRRRENKNVSPVKKAYSAPGNAVEKGISILLEDAVNRKISTAAGGKYCFSDSNRIVCWT
jgi:hypothetical protein